MGVPNCILLYIIDNFPKKPLALPPTFWVVTIAMDINLSKHAKLLEDNQTSRQSMSMAILWMTRIMTQELKWTEMLKKSTISMQLYTFSMKRFRYVT